MNIIPKEEQGSILVVNSIYPKNLRKTERRLLFESVR